MTKEQFWKIIDQVNAEVDTNDQKAILNAVKEKLSKLSAKEIAVWKNIQTEYIKLADRVDLQQAAADNGIYLSDDSFYYFRAWLLSKGQEVFTTVLQEPNQLSRYIEDPGAANFESFSYVSHDVYREVAFVEEHGEAAMRKLEEEWRAQNPNEKVFDPYWLLYDKYDIYDACDAYPLGDTEKKQMRQEIFSPGEKEGVHWMKIKKMPSVVEKTVLQKIPQEKKYRRISVELNSGYEWGSGMLPAAKTRFHREMKELFTTAGWEYVAPAFDTASPSYRKGKSLLYCHPMELSGPCEESLMEEVAHLLKNAVHCTVLSFKDEGRVYDIADERYTEILQTLRGEIEKDLLNAFSAENTMSDSDRCTSVMEQYRIMTLDRTTNVLSSSCPYWRCIEEVLKDLIKQKKIIEKPDVTRFSNQHYMTAPAFKKQKQEKIDSQIEEAALRTNEKKRKKDKEGIDREL